MLQLSEYIVKTGKLFHHTAGMRETQFLHVRDDRFLNIASDNPRSDIPLIDFSQYTISPLFCDHHLHFFSNARYSAQEILSELVRYGIACVYEGGDAACGGIAMKRDASGSLTVKTSGYALYKAGGYGSFLGKAVRGTDEAKPCIDELARMGVDYIKLIQSGFFDPKTNSITAGGFENKELADIVQYAGDKGLSVFCHANGDIAVRSVVEAGAAAVIHGFFASDETLRLMARNNVALVPTINALFSLTKISKTPEEKKAIEQLVALHQATVRRAADMGVVMRLGSDAGPPFIPYGSSFIAELEFLRKSGFTLRETLMATAGSDIEAGASADLVVLDDTCIVKVYRSGKCVFGS